MRAPVPKKAGTRIFTREFDFVGSSAAVLDPAFPAFAAAVERRASAALPYEREGFSRDPGPRLLDDAAVAALPRFQGGEDIVVSILVDQSGNLRGRKSDAVVQCVDRLALALEGAGVPFEVLGFSTLRWKGGLSRERWLAAGRPESPGRLSDLMHIVHKETEEAWTSGSPAPRERLDLMMRSPYMREGLDGEAIAWALDRLATRGPSKRVLVAVGDATPIDDATLHAESEAFVEADLIRAIRRAAVEGVIVEAVATSSDAATPEFFPKTTYMPPPGEDMDPAAAAEAVVAALGLVPEPAPSPRF